MADITGTNGNNVLNGTLNDDLNQGLGGNDYVVGFDLHFLFGGDGDDYLEASDDGSYRYS